MKNIKHKYSFNAVIWRGGKHLIKQQTNVRLKDGSWTATVEIKVERMKLMVLKIHLGANFMIFVFGETETKTKAD